MAYEYRPNRAEINRLNNAIAAEEQNINAIFQRMGQTYYAAHRKDPEESQVENIRAIQEALERGKRIKEQINTLRGIAICPKCNAEVSVTSAFCNRCGAQMPVQAPPVQPMAEANVICPRCGTRCASGQRFCNSCGSPLPAAPTPGYGAPTPGYGAPTPGYGAPTPAYAPTPAAPAYAPTPAAPAYAPTPAAPAYAPTPAAPAYAPAPAAPAAPAYVAEPETAQPSEPLPQAPVSEPVPEEAPAVEPAPPAPPVPETAPEEEFTAPRISEIPDRQEPAPENKICPNCGTVLEPDCLFCLECGTKL